MSDEDAKLMLEKAVVKEAIQEWLDKQFSSFGKWTLVGVASALFSAAVLWVFHWILRR